MQRAVILDRDGVINVDSSNYIRSPDDWEPIPGSIEAIASMSRHGYQVHVATNQSGIARGYFSYSTLNQIHHKMRQAVETAGGHIDGIFFSPYGPDDDASCRKPAPGMLLDLARRTNINLSQTWMVGDSLRDLQAAEAAGAMPALVLSGNGQDTLTKHGASLDENLAVFPHLSAFAEYLLLSA